MSLSSRVRALERGGGRCAAPADCPVCHGRGAGAVHVIHEPEPGEPAAPLRPAGCTACGRLAASRLTILLPSRSELARSPGRVWPGGARPG